MWVGGTSVKGSNVLGIICLFVKHNWKDTKRSGIVRCTRCKKEGWYKDIFGG